MKLASPRKSAARISSLSVINFPSRPITRPSGVGLPCLARTSISPRWVIDVAQSITNGNGSSVGIAIVNGLVPSMGSTPKVGAMLGLAFVPVKPIMFSRVAIIAQ